MLTSQDKRTVSEMCIVIFTSVSLYSGTSSEGFSWNNKTFCTVMLARALVFISLIYFPPMPDHTLGLFNFRVRSKSGMFPFHFRLPKKPTQMLFRVDHCVLHVKVLQAVRSRPDKSFLPSQYRRKESGASNGERILTLHLPFSYASALKHSSSRSLCI